MDAELACAIAVLRPSVIVAHEVTMHRCLAVEASAWNGVIFSVVCGTVHSRLHCWGTGIVGDFWIMFLGEVQKAL